ncbi:MAG: hypothetical protein MUE33_00520 [Cytophagaceae bacterium]|jgi:hypothetical protein|nr:hypothetical protein [Cytophagaceae bacterium]
MFRVRDINIFTGIVLCAILFTRISMSKRPELEPMTRSLNFLIVVTFVVLGGVNLWAFKNRKK